VAASLKRRPPVARAGSAGDRSGAGDSAGTGRGAGEGLRAGEVPRVRLGVALDLVHHAVAAVVAVLTVPGVAGQLAAGLLLVELWQETGNRK